MSMLSQDTVSIHPYDKQWPLLFETEKELLTSLFGVDLLAVEHIGSTSVPGMDAKPVIDVQAAFQRLPLSSEQMAKLTTLGYEHIPIPETVISSSVYMQFRKLGEDGVTETHMLHAKVLGELWQETIDTREYLRLHEEERLAYAKAKKQLASKHSNVKEYTLAKRDFVMDLLRKSKEWAKKNHQEGRT